MLKVKYILPLFVVLLNGTLVSNIHAEDFDEEIKLEEQKYVYAVDFTGDYAEAEQLAMSKLLFDVSSGIVDVQNVNLNTDALISNEYITDDSKLKVVFNSNEVDNFISNGKIPTWKGLSEPLIVWMVKGQEVSEIDQDNNITSRVDARIVSADSKDLLATELEKLAKANNITIIYPMNDLEDMAKVNVSTVLQGNAQKISDVSRRYTPGYAISSILNAVDNNEYEMFYHVIDVMNNQEVYMSTVRGSEERIASVLLSEFKSRIGRSIVGSQLRASVAITTPVSDGFDDNSLKTLGTVDNVSYTILLRNVPNFKSLMTIQNNLMTLGLNNVAIASLKNQDVIFSFKNKTGIPLENLMNLYPALVKSTNENDKCVYFFDSNNTEGIVISNESQEKRDFTSENSTVSNETSEKINYNEPIENNGGSSVKSNYPDPNRKLKTGGGIAK